MLNGTATRASQGPSRSFIRWFGGKQRQLAVFAPLFPERFEVYFEPFLGSGAVFFHLVRTGRLRNGAVLSDVNDDLVTAFRCLRDVPEEVIERLQVHQQLHCAAHYAAVKQQDWLDGDGSAPNAAVHRAARFIYLTNAAFNGSWRVRADGRLTSSPSSDARFGSVNATLIRAASRALQHAAIGRADFRDALQAVAAGDLVLLDPPFLSEKGADVGRYTSPRFTASDEVDVWRSFRDLERRGATVILSSPWSAGVLHAFRDCTVRQVRSAGGALEALITNVRT